MEEDESINMCLIFELLNEFIIDFGFIDFLFLDKS